MKILGFMGSPRTKGRCSRLLQKALDGAQSNGAEIKQFNLIKHNIKFCRGCGSCFLKNPELMIGKCPLQDDMAGILEEYLQADGYFYASPTYDIFVTALMKMFLERKIALTYKEKEGVIPVPRPGVSTNFTKKASVIITGNSIDDFKEVMCDPCVEAVEGHLMLEQIDTLDTLYVGGVETITDKTFSDRLEKAYQMGAHMVKVLEKTEK